MDVLAVLLQWSYVDRRTHYHGAELLLVLDHFGVSAKCGIDHGHAGARDTLYDVLNKRLGRSRVAADQFHGKHLLRVFMLVRSGQRA